MRVLFNIFMRQKLADDFLGLHKNMNCAFPLKFALFNQGSLTFLVYVKTNLKVFNLVLVIKIENTQLNLLTKHICLICASRRTGTYLEPV